MEDNMRKWIRRLGIAVAGFVIVLALSIGGVYGFSSSGFKQTYDVPQSALAIPTDSASIEWGHHLVFAVGKCVECHGPDLGGKAMVDDPAFGHLESSNLTRGKGGIGSTYTDNDFVRALRHGVRPDGTPLLFMPSQEFTYFSDADLASVIAYLKSVPPVDRERKATHVGPLARALYVAKKLPLVPAELIDHKAAPVATVQRGPTAAYGKYLARVGGCQGCHWENLSGGPMPGGGPPGTPPAANLTPSGIGSWSLADFTLALREGTRPDGRKLNPFMPFVYTRQMTDEEITAVYEYLKTLPPTPTGKH
jgi:mono/diheme cytochrome c family protein